MFKFVIEPFNILVTVVTSESESAACSKKYDVQLPYPQTGARVTTLWKDNDKSTSCVFMQFSAEVMKLAKHKDNSERSRLAGLVTHECIHAFDAACESVGEDRPSPEFKCYSVQAMTQLICFRLWEKQHGKNKPEPKPKPARASRARDRGAA